LACYTHSFAGIDITACFVLPPYYSYLKNTVKTYSQPVLYALTAALLGAGFPINAQTLPQTDTHRFDTSTELPTPPERIPHAPAQADDVSAPLETQPVPFLANSDEAADQMAQHIGQFIRQQQWAALSSLLAEYESHPRADPLLVLYAKGALYRQQKDYLAAIAAFSDLLSAQPELHHIRLDLALMQMEDKQYAEAIKTFDGLVNSAQVPVHMRQLAENYQTQLRKMYTLDMSFSSSYTRNDNVNQASSERILTIGGIRFVRAEESLPKVGHGVNYAVGLRRMLPLKARHTLSFDLNYYGVHYWDQHDYSERSVRLAPAWLYQSHQQWVKVGPIYERNWLGDSRYGFRAGAQAEWGRKLSDQHYLIPYIQYANKHYVLPTLARYEGDHYRTGLNWVFQPVSRMRTSLGASQQWDVLNDKSESSRTSSLHAGNTYRADSGLNLQANAQVGQRDFYAPHFLFGTTRRDRELSASVGLWHEKLSVRGISPKLVYQYRRIHSNLPALYSRKSHGLMLEMVAIAF